MNTDTLEHANISTVADPKSFIFTFIGSWHAQMEAHAVIVAGFEKYLESLSFTPYYMAENAEQLDVFFTAMRKTCRVIYVPPIESTGSVKSMGFVFSQYTANVIAITADEKFIKKEGTSLLVWGYKKIIVLAEADLFGSGLFHKVFNEIFPDKIPC